MNTIVSDEQINQHIVAKHTNEKIKCKKILEFTLECPGPEPFLPAPDPLLVILTVMVPVGGSCWGWLKVMMDDRSVNPSFLLLGHFLSTILPFSRLSFPSSAVN